MKMRAISAKASASCSLSPALFWPIVACSFWTRQQARSTRAPRGASRRLWTTSCAGRHVVRHRSSLVDHSQCRFNSSFCKKVTLWNKELMRSCLRRMGPMLNSITHSLLNNHYWGAPSKGAPVPSRAIAGTHEGRISVWKRSCAGYRRALQGNRARLTMRSWRRQQQRLDARRQRASHAIAAFDFDGTSIQGNSPYCSCAICAA